MKPFLKWLGGKTQLLPVIEQHMPKRFKGYHEPLVGGGALLFHLLGKGHKGPTTIADSNEGLIKCYQVVRDHVDDLVDDLGALELEYRTGGADYYYRVRDNYGALLGEQVDTIAAAARIIFLNKTAFNGLFRVNKSGHFNVSHGRYVNPKICDEPNLRAVSAALQRVNILCMDFDESILAAEKDDLVYLDPPYWPVSETANFTGFTKDGFDAEDQRDLASAFTEASERGALLMLSNSDTPFTRELYAGFFIHPVRARRNVSRDGKGRGPVPEILVTNY